MYLNTVQQYQTLTSPKCESPRGPLVSVCAMMTFTPGRISNKKQTEIQEINSSKEKLIRSQQSVLPLLLLSAPQIPTMSSYHCPLTCSIILTLSIRFAASVLVSHLENAFHIKASDLFHSNLCYCFMSCTWLHFNYSFSWTHSDQPSSPHIFCTEIQVMQLWAQVRAMRLQQVS